MVDQTKPEIMEVQLKNKYLKKEQNKVAHFYQWLKKSPVSFDLIDFTTEDDILTINFHGKDIFKKTISNWNKENDYIR